MTSIAKNPVSTCTYPVQKSAFARASFKHCGATAETVAFVPYPKHHPKLGFVIPNQFELKRQLVCLQHSCMVSAWRLAASLPGSPWTTDELLQLIDAGFDHDEIAYLAGGYQGPVKNPPIDPKKKSHSIAELVEMADSGQIELNG